LIYFATEAGRDSCKNLSLNILKQSVKETQLLASSNASNKVQNGKYYSKLSQMFIIIILVDEQTTDKTKPIFRTPHLVF